MLPGKILVPVDGSDLAAVPIARRRDGIEMPEQLVSTIDEVDIHSKLAPKGGKDRL